MKSSHRLTLRINTTLLHYSSICLLVFIFLSACSDPRLNEDSLRKKFSDNITALNKLAEMQHQDVNVVRISPEFTRLKNDYSWPRKDIGFSQSRWDEYRALFAQIGLTSGMEAIEDSIIFGVVDGSGYLYTEDPDPQPVFKSKKECDKDTSKGSCLIFLTEHWYLYWR